MKLSQITTPKLTGTDSMKNMVRSKPLSLTLALAASVLLSPAIGFAALLASESFAVVASGYTVGQLYGQNPSVGLSGFTGNWTNSDVTATNSLAIETGGLTASLTPGTLRAGQASTTGTTADRAVFHQFSTTGIGTTNTTYYYSFLLNSSHTTRAAFGLNALGLRTPPSGLGSLLGVNVGVTTISLVNTVVLYVNGATSTLLSNYTADTTYYVLVDITNNTAGNDLVNARLFSNTATDLLTPLGQSLAQSGEVSANLGYLGFTTDNNIGNGMNVDEFRFGTALLDVSTVPEPTTFAMLLGTLGLLTMLRRRRA